MQRWIAGWADEAALVEAEELARRAVDSLDPNDYANHWDLAIVYLEHAPLRAGARGIRQGGQPQSQ